MEKEECCQRCDNLMKEMDGLAAKEPDGRVWMPVITTVLMGLILTMKDPRTCFDELIKSLEQAMQQFEEEKNAEKKSS